MEDMPQNYPRKAPFQTSWLSISMASHRLNWQDIIAISATGSGKSAYIYMVATALVALGTEPLLGSVKEKVFQRPCACCHLSYNCARRRPCLF
ncbi:hypothetical protein BYT27DRAFT_6774130 [Phlegmacium glaucopus]|nr:hypothetical protein BYT27DRAFT_6774130 [Phlegmacium glaucopus]